MMATQPTPESLRPKRPTAPQLSREEQLDTQYRSHMEQVHEYLKFGQPRGAMRMALEAFKLDSSRLEALEELTPIYRTLEMHDEADENELMLAAMRALKHSEGQLSLPI